MPITWVFPEHETQVKLAGPTSYVLTAIPDPDQAALDHYVARLSLPVMDSGDYTVSVSRDGTNWVNVDQLLTVKDDPPAPTYLYPQGYGGCTPSDGIDDTLCIKGALNAADPGETVYLASGDWLLEGLTDTPGPYGLVVEQGVSLKGLGAEIRITKSWSFTCEEPDASEDRRTQRPGAGVRVSRRPRSGKTPELHGAVWGHARRCR